MRAHTLSLVALALMPLTTAMAITFQPTPVERPHRLVGFGCGPEKLVTTAAEEDEMLGGTQCEQIETSMALCGHDDAVACADYMGRDGWS